MKYEYYYQGKKVRTSKTHADYKFGALRNGVVCGCSSKRSGAQRMCDEMIKSCESALEEARTPDESMIEFVKKYRNQTIEEYVRYLEEELASIKIVELEMIEK